MIYVYYMIIVKLDKNIGIEKALKLLKSKVIKTKQSQALIERKTYQKKSVKRRNQLKKAKYVEQLRRKDD